MGAWVLLLAFAAPAEGAAVEVRAALETARRDAPDRVSAIVELAATLGLPPSAFGPAAASVAAARDRLGAPASWRVRDEGDVVEVDLVDPSGRLDLIRAWYVTPTGQERIHATGAGRRWRFRTPRGWPGHGRLRVEASSSLLDGAPTLLEHVVAPVGDAPVAPRAGPRSLASGADPPALREASGSVPWWVLAAGAIAAGAFGLGVWQEAR